VACMCGWQGALTCGGACGCSGESSLLGAVEKATAEAEKHGDRSEKLSALVAEAKGMIEQAKTKQAERAKAAAAVTAAAEAAEAAQRLHDEEELAALTLRVQQVQARLGSSVVPPADAEETMCVVCFDAPKDHILVPCYHLCVCEACANLLTQMDKPTCPICRAAIRQTNKVFQS
jgi:transcription elongation GreA/GreB family factor